MRQFCITVNLFCNPDNAGHAPDQRKQDTEYNTVNHEIIFFFSVNTPDYFNSGYIWPLSSQLHLKECRKSFFRAIRLIMTFNINKTYT